MQIAEGGAPRGKNAVKEAFKVALLQRLSLGQNAAVLLHKMQGAQNGTVAKALAQTRNGRKQLSLVHLAKHVLAQRRGNRLHLGRHGGVILGQVGVVASRVDDAKTVAERGEIKLQLFHHGGLGIGKVDGHDAACGAGDLVHQSAGLAEEDVLGILRDAGDLHEGDPAAVVEMVEDRADHVLKGGRGGKPRASWDV